MNRTDPVIPGNTPVASPESEARISNLPLSGAVPILVTLAASF